MTHHQGLRQRIVTLPLVKSLSRNHMANSSCYRRRLVDRRIYLRVWSRDCLFLPIEKAAAIIYILLLMIDLQGWYKSVKVTIDTPGFAKVIFDVVVCHHCFPGSVVTDRGAFYSLKTCYCCAIFYASDVRCSHSTAFYLQISGPTERPKSSQQSISFELSSVSSYCHLLAR